MSIIASFLFLPIEHLAELEAAARIPDVYAPRFLGIRLGKDRLSPFWPTLSRLAREEDFNDWSGYAFVWLDMLLESQGQATFHECSLEPITTDVRVHDSSFWVFDAAGAQRLEHALAALPATREGMLALQEPEPNISPEDRQSEAAATLAASNALRGWLRSVDATTVGVLHVG